MNKNVIWMMSIMWFSQGVIMTVKAPYMVYRAFTGESFYHWLTWVAFYYCIAGFWQAAFAVYRQGVGVDAAMILLFAGLIFAVLQALTKIFMKASGPFAFLGWVPGQGKLRAWIGRKSPSMPIGGGAAKADETLLRGAAVVSGDALGASMKQGVSEADLAGVIEWGGVPVVPSTEPQHFLIEGMTGAGKSQAINEMMRKVRFRNQAAVIADTDGGYLARFGREGDIVLNPFDKRTVDWSPFAEIEADYDYRLIAKAAIPDGIGENEQWTTHGQVLFAECMRVLHKRGESSVKRLLYYVTAADNRELADLLGDSPASVLTKPGNERMLGSVRSSAGTPLSNWVYLVDQGTFSVRKWVRDSDTKRGCLFLTYTARQMPELRNLVACWLELAIVEGLSMSESNTRRLWYIMDELDSLGKISSLRGGLTKLRKYGGVCVSGLQTISQLRTTYGHDEAQTLLSCMGTKLMLRAGDAETGKYFENEIGQQEVEREETSEGTSHQIGNFASRSENKSTRRHVQSAVLASELTSLPDLQGYLKMIGKPVARITMPHVAMPDINAPYLAK